MAKKAAKTTPKASTSGSVYDDIRNELKSATFSGGKFWKPRDGANVVRFFPFIDPETGKEKLWVKDNFHWLGKTAKPSSVPCIGAKCVICKAAEDLTGDAKKALYPRQQFLANIVDRATGEQQIGQFAFTVFKAVSMAMAGEVGNDGEYVLDPQVPNALDPKKGHDFQIKKVVNGKKTEYFTSAKQVPTALGVDVIPVNLFERRRKMPEDSVLREIAENIGDILPKDDDDE